MNVEVLALGVLSGLRPATAQAAVIALLRTPAPLRALLAYTAAGMGMTVAIGVVVVVAFDGIGRQFGHSDFTAVVDILAGVAALGFAAGVSRAGLADRIHERRAAGNHDTRIARRLREPSVIDAAVAGIVTHLPGLIYLIALNSIVAAQEGPARSTLQIVAYNLLWFALPIAAFVLSVSNPRVVSDQLERASGWAMRNRDRLLVALFGALGLYLVAKGAIELLR
jgi:Sap, sulfolipid-1-addressing protein